MNESLGDKYFDAGQLADAKNLGDTETAWLPAFKGELHGVLLVLVSLLWVYLLTILLLRV